MLTRLALIAATITLLLAPTARAADPAEITKNLMAVLQSDAIFFEKARACQQLGEIGTPDAVPVLAGLLTDPKLSAYARSGLEGIPGPSAAAALRDAAGRIKGPMLAGVVNSLGVLRDVQAVEVLAKLAADPTSGVVKESLLALGNISTPASLSLLGEALTSGPDMFRGAAGAACLLAADRQRTNGDLTRAVALYDLIRHAKAPTACIVGATRGAILARKSDRVPFLIEQLRSRDLAIRNAALLTIRDIHDDAVAAALNAEIDLSPPELQGQLVLALADCHNAQSIPVLQALDGSTEPAIRKTALLVLGRIGPTAAPALLAALEKARPEQEKAAIVSGLRAMDGVAVDDLLLQALTSAKTPGLRMDLIQLLDSRGVMKAAPELMKQAATADKDVRIAALSAMKSLAGISELPALLALTRSSADDEVRDVAENALAGVCSRSGESASETVLNELKQATKAPERNGWIRVLARAGYAKALPTIAAAASDPDPAVADNALAELGHWPNPAPMETLLTAMDSGASASLRQRALVSVIDLATTATDEAQAPEAKIVNWLEHATRVARSTQDKLRIVGLLGRLKTVGSLRLLVSYLDDSSVQTEAASGVVQIAPALAKEKDASALKTALEKISTTAANGDVRNRALQAAKLIPAPSPPVGLTGPNRTPPSP